MMKKSVCTLSCSNILSLLFIFSLFSCVDKNGAELIIINGKIYTVSNGYAEGDALVIRDGKIDLITDSREIEKYSGKKTEVIDAGENFIMPGFIEGHGHFSGLGYSLLNLNFINSRSWEEIVSMVEEKVKTAQPGEWIIGRGWHQEKWDSVPFNNVLGYPFHKELSQVSPNNPVVLRHASGHSLFANKKAMDEAGVNIETPNPPGGEVVRSADGEAIGVFEERAMRIVNEALFEYQNGLSQEERLQEWYKAIELAQEECLKKGVTSFQDAGSSFEELERYHKLAKDKKLNIRLWVMARHNSATLEGNVGQHRIIGAGDNFYTCRSIKSEVDGALGAFGAWLIEPYTDKPDFHGQNTTDIYEVKKIADIAMANEMQLCVHAIGDRANKVVVDIFEGTIGQTANKDHRWRIEHAQHLDTSDIPRFKELNIIASMQGIHCTSDAPFVEKRLGKARAQFGSYPWRTLLDHGVIIANGTDAPVEDVDPIPSFYASVTRKRLDTGYAFYPEQSMSREEAIYSYTLGNAFAAFEENVKGSIEVGKVADLIILSNDLIRCSDEEIPETSILYTIVNGKVKFKKK
ncbi:MAG TPA: amidohydrolase [Saprospiraceae bacterium]|nr:amidohydrolase [Saprospiraceae bacterium]